MKLAKELISKAHDAIEMSYTLTNQQKALRSCAAALATHAGVVFLENFQFEAFEEPNWIMAAAVLCNRWCKPDVGPGGAEATCKISQWIFEGQERLRSASPAATALFANAFSKRLEHEECAVALECIGRCVGREAEGAFNGYSAQDKANLANAFSKSLNREDCAAALGRLGRCVANETEGTFDGYKAQEKSNLANAFSKCLTLEDCADALASLARHVIEEAKRDFDGYTNQSLANLANAFSKCLTLEDCADALASLARHVIEEAKRDFDGYTNQSLANLANAFCKGLEHEACVEAVIEVVARCVPPHHTLSQFSTIGLTQIANACGRLLTATDLDATAGAVLHDWLGQLTNYLTDERETPLSKVDLRAIDGILTALRRAGHTDDLRDLGGLALDRVKALHEAGSTRLADSETLGGLSGALRTFLIDNRLQRHKRRALTLLEEIQPAIWEKIGHLHAEIDREPADETAIRALSAGGGGHGSRIPVISALLVLQTYEAVASSWRRPFVVSLKGGTTNEKRQHNRGVTKRRDELLEAVRALAKDWQERILASELSAGPDFLARVSADDLLDSLDRFGVGDGAHIAGRRAPAAFDLGDVLEAMKGPPRPPGGTDGLMQLRTLDLRGRQTDQEPESRYAIIHRLTQGRVSPVMVQMSRTVGAYALSRTVKHAGVPHRLDLFGGSAMKAQRVGPGDILAAEPGRQAEAKGGKLMAVPWADTLPGTAFVNLLRRLMPNKEAFYYAQRMMRPAPPNIPVPTDLPGCLRPEPHDHVLEGRFAVMVLPDDPPDTDDPFRLVKADGTLLALRPYNGCGFVKASLVELMPMFAKLKERHRDVRWRVEARGTDRLGNLPSQALQHYERSDKVRDEVRGLLPEADAGRKALLDGDALFRTTTAGRIQGHSAVAVPSSDGQLHVPAARANRIQPSPGVLVGRAPYDIANLRPIPADKVGLKSDPTAQFLGTCQAIQYSLVAQICAAGEEAAADRPLFFAKGVLVVVPDEIWPDAFAAWNLVLSAEDTKTQSGWVKAKQREKTNTSRPCVGILQATEYFAPGSMVAVPPDEQKCLGGDFDGDRVILIGDRPKLFEHVAQHEAKRGKRPRVTITKSHTSAIDKEGVYWIGRGRQILTFQSKVLEIYTGLQRDYLAQSPEKRLLIAERGLFGSLEGFPPGLRRKLSDLLRDEENGADDVASCSQPTVEGVRAAQDKVKEWLYGQEPAVKHQLAFAVGIRLQAELAQWAAQRNAPTNDDSGARAPSVGFLWTALRKHAAPLLPDFAEAVAATADVEGNGAVERLRALLDFPDRLEPYPKLVYDPNDPCATFEDLLSLGINVGTDAYKSDTATAAYGRLARRLQSLVASHVGDGIAPYAKATERKLRDRTFDVVKAREALLRIPNAAASAMEGGLLHLEDIDRLPQFGTVVGDAVNIFPALKDGDFQRL